MQHTPYYHHTAQEQPGPEKLKTVHETTRGSEVCFLTWSSISQSQIYSK